MLCIEIFAWGKYGGFGKATRTIGRELVKRGIEVFACVPRRDGQSRMETLDGITVLSYPSLAPWKAIDLMTACDADIYHSSEPSLATYFALKALPRKKHIATIRDPRDFRDWEVEFRLPSLNRYQVALNYLYENNCLVRRSIKEMDRVYSAAPCLIPKIKRIYRLTGEPWFLPTPVSVPSLIEKARKPTVCFVSRLDRRKRPELFLSLASRFPSVNFLVVGRSRNIAWEKHLKKKYSDLANVEFTGFIDQFQSNALQKIFDHSWILVNTASREGLPNAFLEAAASKCAILSYVNPDGFAEKFGFHAKKHNFSEGLAFLLENNRWKSRGEKARLYVKETYEAQKAIDRHMEAYTDLFSP